MVVVWWWYSGGMVVVVVVLFFEFRDSCCCLRRCTLRRNRNVLVWVGSSGVTCSDDCRAVASRAWTDRLAFLFITESLTSTLEIRRRIAGLRLMAAGL